MDAQEKLKMIREVFDYQHKVGNIDTSTHAHTNLVGAVVRLKNTGVDSIALDTLKRVEEQLACIAAILEMP